MKRIIIPGRKRINGSKVYPEGLMEIVQNGLLGKTDDLDSLGNLLCTTDELGCGIPGQADHHSCLIAITIPG